MPPHELLPGAISALFADALNTGTITPSDRYGLMAAIMTDDLDSDERSAVDRLIRLIKRGKIKMHSTVQK